MVSLKWCEIFIWNDPCFLSPVSLTPQMIASGPLRTSAMANETKEQKIRLWFALAGHLKGFAGANYFGVCCLL